MADKLTNDALLTLKLKAADRIKGLLGKEGLVGHYSVPNNDQLSEGIFSDLVRSSNRNEGITPEMLAITVSQDKVGKIINLLTENGINKFVTVKPNGKKGLLFFDVVANKKAIEQDKNQAEVPAITDIGNNVVSLGQYKEGRHL